VDCKRGGPGQPLDGGQAANRFSVGGRGANTLARGPKRRDESRRCRQECPRHIGWFNQCQGHGEREQRGVQLRLDDLALCVLTLSNSAPLDNAEAGIAMELSMRSAIACTGSPSASL